jgi:hypothetical protein
MSNVNDQKILELKAQISEKKEKLKKVNKFTPITNCSIEFEGTRLNLRVLGKEVLVPMLIKLNDYKKSAEELNLLSEYNISGYNINDWITDIRARLYNVMYKEEENKLAAMENKLELLLSNEKKVELEINEIENLLK